MTSSPSSDRPSFSAGRKFGAGVGVLIASLSVLAVVIMLNYLGGRHVSRRDCSTAQRWQLSPRTLKVLEAINTEVKIIVFYSKNERLYKESTDLLREYTAHCPYLKIDLVDPDANPVQASLVKNQYHLAAANQKNLVIFDCGKKIRTVYQQALSDYEMEQVEGSSEREFRRHTKNFKGEAQFTTALVGVMNPRPLKAYFLEGHGEHDPASNDLLMGYSKFTGVLEESGISADTLSLLGSAEVPADCSLLIIAGPINALSQDELVKIAQYLNAGGRLLAAINYRSFGKHIGLEALLNAYGIVVGESYILDPSHATPEAQFQDLKLLFDATPAHPITRPLALQAFHLQLPRAVSAMQSGAHPEIASKVDELLHTTPEGVMVFRTKNGLPDINLASDPRGIYSLICAAEIGAVPGLKAGRGSTRMIVSGDSMCFGNKLLDSAANRDFVTHAVNWLVDQPYLLSGISPRPVKEYRLNLTNAQMTSAYLVMLVGMPGSVLVLGALVWLRRRK